MFKIVDVGGPCSGKSTLIRALVNELGSKGVNGSKVTVDFMEEYPRTYIREYGPPASVFEQMFLMDKMLEKEELLASSGTDIIICDSATFCSHPYAILYLGGHGLSAEVEENKFEKGLQEIYAKGRANQDSYDLIFFLEPVPLVEDGTRFNTNDAQLVADRIEAYMILHGLSYITLETHPDVSEKVSINRRVKKAMKEISKHPKAPK